MNRKNKFLHAAWLAVVALVVAACSVDQHFEFPQGPKGDKGDKGLSAYEVWLEEIKNDSRYEGGYEEGDFFLYLKGAQGDKGEKGDDGETPGLPDPSNYVPEIIDGYWYINGENTGVPATGDDGDPGVGAYDYWVTRVKTGTVKDPNTGELWPETMTSEHDFWVFLAAADGAPGISAYDEWVLAIKEPGGVPNPHEDPNVEGDETWDPESDGPADYWYFFSGENGKHGLSAYELWKADVLDADGLAHPKFPNTNVKWPTSQVGQEHFWEYLKGLDGKDGQNGAVFPIENGYYNVIVQDTEPGYGEFVDSGTGSVTFIVYGKDGEPLEGAKITQMPGIDYEAYYAEHGEELVFTSLEGGKFTVGRELLPEDEDQEYRLGPAWVQEDNQTQGEWSASNTYVPERMAIRLRLRSAITLSNGVMNFPVIVERREAFGEDWEVIPNHIDNITSKAVKWYWVADQNAYTIPNASPYGTSFIGDISISTASIGLSRPKVIADNVFVDAWEKQTTPTNSNSSLYGWDGESVQYFVGQLDGLYGTTAQLVKVENLGTETETEKPVVTQRVPIQRVPIIKNVSMGNKNTHDLAGYPNYTMSASGLFDVSKVSYDYFYNTTLTELPSANHVWIYPTKMDPVEVDKIKMFQVRFLRSNLPGGDESIVTSQSVTLVDTNWSISSSVFDGATVQIIIPTGAPRNHFFGSSDVSAASFGVLSFGENEINNRSTAIYNMDDISVTFAE